MCDWKDGQCKRLSCSLRRLEPDSPLAPGRFGLSASTCDSLAHSFNLVDTETDLWQFGIPLGMIEGVGLSEQRAERRRGRRFSGR